MKGSPSRDVNGEVIGYNGRQAHLDAGRDEVRLGAEPEFLDSNGWQRSHLHRCQSGDDVGFTSTLGDNNDRSSNRAFSSPTSCGAST